MRASVALANATRRVVPKVVSRHAKLSANVHTVPPNIDRGTADTRHVKSKRDYRRFPLLDLNTRAEIDSFLSEYSELELHRQLQPTSNAEDKTPEQVTAEEVHHIQRLSALRTSKDPETTERLRQILEKQLNFVKMIQDIDVSNVEPLVSLGEVLSDAQKETSITLKSLQHVFDKEERVGRYRRIVPKKTAVDGSSSPERAQVDWDPLKIAPATSGAFIKVPAKVTDSKTR